MRGPLQPAQRLVTLQSRPSASIKVSAAPARNMTNFPTSWRIRNELQKLDVWSVFSPASGYVPKDSINLGQGFMNFGPPAFAKDGARSAVDEVEANHYSIPKGRINLRNAVAKELSPSFGLPNGRSLDVNTEMVITAGANEGILSFLTAFVEEGDEVIVMEPFFDQYIPNITFNGGKPVYVPLRPPKNASTGIVQASEWKLDSSDLRKAITKKTKVIMLNTPHNPVGKVFTKDELIEIGKIAEEYNLLILADEVYDNLAFAPSEHVRIASLGFWDRTITCGSAGKSFSCTGWRVGYMIGPEHLVKPTTAAHTRIVFTVNSPLQEAVAAAFNNKSNFFDEQREQYIERRDVLMKALDRLGLPYTIPDGAYFILVNISKLKIPADFEVLDLIKSRTRDWHASWFFAKEAGIVAIPPTDFYSEQNAEIGATFIRLAFCKDVDTLKQAGERLQKLKPFIESR